MLRSARFPRHLLPCGIRHVIRHMGTTYKPSFFSRREIECFTKEFSGSPRLHVVLGLPSTGITALVRKVLDDGCFSPLFIDLRRGEFDTPKSVYDSLHRQFNSFFDKFKEHFKHTATLSYNYQNREHNAGDISELLNNISSKLPNWTFWKGYNVPSPVLVINEANVLNQLGEKSKEGEVLINSFLSWLVQNTKQEQRFHVVLTSSDPFFLEWIVKQLHIQHVASYVVGDLSKEEAKKIFEEHVLPNNPFICAELSGRFDRVCKFTGTRMFHFHSYVHEYPTYLVGGKFEDSSISLYVNAYCQLLESLWAEIYAPKDRRARWKRDDFIKAMKTIMEKDKIGSEFNF